MRQAVVIMHGMGEQIPMQTLNSFVKSVWTTDDALVEPEKPDPNTGGKRSENAWWAKPDERNSSTELRRITTERDRNGDYTDFFEYYWAHLMQGTTWEHVQTWILDLLFRNPRKRVPRRVLHAWIVLWIITILVVGVTVRGLWPSSHEPKPWITFGSAIFGMAASAFVSAVLIKRFGDVARYVKALPPNVAKRHAIRQGGVDLLKRLIDGGEYDRIVVVSHSLGTIVAYDILSMLFASYNTVLDGEQGKENTQPKRHQMEEMIRTAATGDGELDIDAFQTLQADVFEEAKAQGAKWNISDFVTLGSPLTHAEFLRAESKSDLRARQRVRLMPTCPPTLEYDGTTRLQHFTFSGKKERKPEDQRVPHHAALFGYTRWTNLYSDEKAILTGDLISGPLAEAFGLEAGELVLRGIRDVGVLPKLTQTGSPDEGHRRKFCTHTSYWDKEKRTERESPAVPHHIAELRKALRLLA